MSLLSMTLLVSDVHCFYRTSISGICFYITLVSVWMSFCLFYGHSLCGTVQFVLVTIRPAHWIVFNHFSSCLVTADDHWSFQLSRPHIVLCSLPHADPSAVDNFYLYSGQFDHPAPKPCFSFACRSLYSFLMSFYLYSWFYWHRRGQLIGWEVCCFALIGWMTMLCLGTLRCTHRIFHAALL